MDAAHEPVTAPGAPLVMTDTWITMEIALCCSPSGCTSASKSLSQRNVATSGASIVFVKPAVAAASMALAEQRDCGALEAVLGPRRGQIWKSLGANTDTVALFVASAFWALSDNCCRSISHMVMDGSAMCVSFTTARGTAEAPTNASKPIRPEYVYRTPSKVVFKKTSRLPNCVNDRADSIVRAGMPVSSAGSIPPAGPLPDEADDEEESRVVLPIGPHAGEGIAVAEVVVDGVSDADATTTATWGFALGVDAGVSVGDAPCDSVAVAVGVTAGVEAALVPGSQVGVEVRVAAGVRVGVADAEAGGVKGGMPQYWRVPLK